MFIKKTILSIVAATMFAATIMAQTAETFKQPYPLGQQLPTNNNFTGKVWLSTVNKVDSLHLPMVNVTFAPCCINSWHYHTGGPVLIATADVGYYQEKGKAARRLFPGDIVEIAPGTRHYSLAWGGTQLKVCPSCLAPEHDKQRDRMATTCRRKCVQRGCRHKSCCSFGTHSPSAGHCRHCFLYRAWRLGTFALGIGKGTGSRLDRKRDKGNTCSGSVFGIILPSETLFALAALSQSPNQFLKLVVLT